MFCAACSSSRALSFLNYERYRDLGALPERATHFTTVLLMFRS
jgi:hypothetical protein